MTFKTLLSRLARRVVGKSGPGYVDHFDANRVAGWAFDPSEPDQPALLSLYVDGKPEMNILADIPREDVSAAGLGPLSCGFDATLPRRLKDGGPHRVEVRLGATGPVLRGGKLNIAATSDGARQTLDDDDAAQSQKDTYGPAEGVAFYEARGQMIAGWAIGCTDVRVVFHGHPPQDVVLRHEVPGFGTGLRPGFRISVPENLKDGAPHEVQVFFGGSETPLDGSPVVFSLIEGTPLVEVVSLEGPCLTVRLRDLSGRPMQQDVVLLLDGVEQETTCQRDTVAVNLPTSAKTVVVQTTEGTVLARLAVSNPQVQGTLLCELPPSILSMQSFAKASTAFEEFCAAPDARFDPLWYRWSHPEAAGLAEPEALIGHYRTVGAPSGVGPNPTFDEVAALQIYPELAAAISEGHLPCAFAMALVLEQDYFTDLGLISPSAGQLLRQGNTDTAAKMLEMSATASPTGPVRVSLPMPSQALKPTDSIYAAWLSRLEMPANIQSELAQDEYVLRREISASALERAPLVSIIMPSWNRAFTIGEAIQSALEQSYKNWELIICDDASDDRTSEVVRGFDDPRIRYMKFLKSNGAGARNKGLARARGEYIAYLDSDNIWHPLFLDMMLRRLMANPGCCMAYSAFLDTEITGARVHLHGIARSPFRPVSLSSKNFMDLNSIVHHRRVYDLMGGFDNDLPRLQDWDLSLRYTSVFPPIFVNHVGVFYRRNVAWGQVTHLFMGSGVQNTVNEKTRKRLEEGHERLRLNWPRRGRITILCGDAEAGHASLRDLVIAENLARLALPIADVDLIMLGPELETVSRDDAEDGIVRHRLPQELRQDPVRLGKALGGLLRGRPVLSVGCGAQYLRAIIGLDSRLVYQLRGSGEGTVLQCLNTPMIRFNIGAVPMALPEGLHSPADMTALVIPPGHESRVSRVKLRDQLRIEAQRRGLTLLMAPVGDQGWLRIDRTGMEPLTITPEHYLPPALGQVVVTINLVPVSELDAFGLALLNALQSQGVPAAVLPDEGRARATGFARQWIEAKAAYEIKVNDPQWILDKVRKLLEDSSNLNRLSDRSKTVHRIALHPELAQERLAHALYRLLHDIPQQEMIHGTT
jgi:hypothetical protein